MPRKDPFGGMATRFPTMTDITRTGKSGTGVPRVTVGGAGHHPNRGARTAASATQAPAQKPGQVPAQKGTGQ